MTKATVGGSQGRVLLIDDDETVASGLKQLLSERGYEVEARTSPLSVGFLTRRFDPDIVLLDLGMPGLSGEALLRLERRRIFPQNTQIILFSGRDREELATLAVDVSADGFHSKQDDLSQLLAQIPRWVRCRRTRDQYLTAKGMSTCL